MYELNKTLGRHAFKDMLGQANHFLITVLVGLNGVRDGSTSKNDEFRTSWNPQNVHRSVDRSRAFVLDLALVRAIDALDSYMMMSARKPFAIEQSEFVAAMDGTGRSVAARLEVFDAHLKSLPVHHKALLSVAIEWRNGRVHTLSNTGITAKTVRQVLGQREIILEQYNGLDARQFVDHCKAGSAPTFKEAAAVIRFVQQAVAHYDEFLLKQLPIETYLKAALLDFLERGQSGALSGIRKTWSSSKKDIKVPRLLRFVGVSETKEYVGRQVPDEFVQSLISLESQDVLDFLKT